MLNFTYYTPTLIHFGKDSESKVGTLVKEQGCKKVLLHYGGGSVVRSGLLDRVLHSLEDSGIAYVCLGGVVPNPRLSKVEEGIALCKKEEVDFILAVGGGSVIDSAKAIAIGVPYSGNVWDFFEKKAIPTNSLPIGTVLTIAAAGSEMSNSAVITNEDGDLKRGCNTEIYRPKFSILNPELTNTLPEYQTMSGCVDILMHTMERYFSPQPPMELTDEIAEALMRTVIKHGAILKEDPMNYDARAEVMWASSLSHNGLTGCGGSGGDWASHQLEHELSGMFDVPHGAGLSAIWGSWARYVLSCNPARFAKFAMKVFQIAPLETPEVTGLAGIEAMEAFYRSIGMPTNIKELGLSLSEEELQLLADKCSFHRSRTIGSIRCLDRDDILSIYRFASGM